MTNYIVLRNDESGGWLVQSHQDAASPEAAIRKHIEALTTATFGIEFVAIPSRSWKPVKVKIETKTSVQIIAGESVQS